MRTVSSLEALNSQIGRSFQRHANIFKFINSLKMHEFMKSSEMMELSLRAFEKKIQRKHLADKEREAKITFFTALLKRNEVDIGEFLEAMANKSILPSAAFFKRNKNQKKSNLNSKSKTIRQKKKAQLNNTFVFISLIEIIK